MKIFVAFLFLQLTAGILCSDATEPRNISTPPLILEAYMDLLAASRLKDLEYREEEIKQDVIDKCKKNGGPTAYDEVKEGLQGLKNLIESAMNDTINQANLDNFKSWNAEEQIPKICDTMITVTNWTNPARDSLKRCLDEGERATADLMYNMRIAATDFICGNDGSNLISFYSARGFECLMGQPAKNCSVKMPSHDNSTVVTSIQMAGQPWSYEPSYPSVNDCQKIRTLKTCGIEKLSACEPSNVELTTFMTSAFDAVEKAAGCDNILKAQETSVA